MQVIYLLVAFVKIGTFSFGGGYAMIPLLEREIIARHGWLTLREFIDIVAISQMTPGPVAINAATFVGYKVAGLAGAMAATAGVVLPSLVLILLLSFYLWNMRGLVLVRQFLDGLRPAVLALIAAAAWFVARESILDYRSLFIAALVLVAVVRARLHPILALGMAAVLGLFLY